MFRFEIQLGPGLEMPKTLLDQITKKTIRLLSCKQQSVFVVDFILEFHPVTHSI